MTFSERHEDPGYSIHAYTNSALVVCPTCGGRAEVFRAPTANPDGRRTHRLQCPCGLIRESTSSPSLSPPFDVGSGQPRDYVFQLPLWLTTACRGHTLWALNAEHLSAIEVYVAATHRSRAKINDSWVNRSLLSRLPEWMIAAAARDDVLAGVERLKARLLTLR
jgi:hypothetical protein